MVVHLFLNYKYLEPIGYFITSEMWDSVLTVSTVGVAVVMTTKKLLSSHASKRVWGDMAVNFNVPSWYPFFRPWLWVFTFILIIILDSLYGRRIQK